ncbi:MAG: hypothetical protein RR956_06260 [Christensenella sp.]
MQKHRAQNTVLLLYSLLILRKNQGFDFMGADGWLCGQQEWQWWRQG